MTYMHQNRQFVVVGVRGPTGQGAQLMAFALPREEPAGRGGRGGRGGAAGGRGGGQSRELSTLPRTLEARGLDACNSPRAACRA